MIEYEYRFYTPFAESRPVIQCWQEECMYVCMYSTEHGSGIGTIQLNVNACQARCMYVQASEQYLLRSG